MLPAWGENNRNALAAGKAKTPNIHPVLIDREIPKVQAKLDELNKTTQNGAQMTADAEAGIHRTEQATQSADRSSWADFGTDGG